MQLQQWHKVSWFFIIKRYLFISLGLCICLYVFSIFSFICFWFLFLFFFRLNVKKIVEKKKSTTTTTTIDSLCDSFMNYIIFFFLFVFFFLSRAARSKRALKIEQKKKTEQQPLFCGFFAQFFFRWSLTNRFGNNEKSLYIEDDFFRLVVGFGVCFYFFVWRRLLSEDFFFVRFFFSPLLCVTYREFLFCVAYRI